MLPCLNAKGSLIPVVSWLAVIVTVLIVVVWYANNFSMSKIFLEKAENDLSNIRQMVDDACDLSYYRAAYNPSTESGSLDINSTAICIRAEKIYRCKSTVCGIEGYGETKTIDLSKVTDIIVTHSEEGAITIDGQ